MTNEDAKAFQDGVKPTNTSKIKKQEKIILDGKPHEVILAFQNSPLSCKLCNQAFFSIIPKTPLATTAVGSEMANTPQSAAPLCRF